MDVPYVPMRIHPNQSKRHKRGKHEFVYLHGDKNELMELVNNYFLSFLALFFFLSSSFHISKVTENDESARYTLPYGGHPPS